MGKIDLPIPIAVDLIDPSPFPGRITLDDSKMEELIISIRQLGILQNLVVRRKPPNKYELVIGSRRLHAAKKIGMTTVPCMIKDLTDAEVQKQQLSENVQRGDFTDYEIALKLDSMLKNCSNEYPTQEALAFEIGKSRPWVANHLRMLEISPLFHSETMLFLTEGHCRAILEVPIERRPEVAKYITEYNEKAGYLPSMREIKDFASGAVPTSETPILESAIKHEGVEVQRTSEESKDESYQEHDKESVDEEFESCVKCPKCGQIDVSHPTHTCSGCNNKWRVTQKDRLKLPKNKIPKRR